ncbi:MAG: hypothetical protein NTW08_00660 [Gammaproteobacteria bacterium]|nr:hypothetical protein [Gammaproteobacteria bacterium]
MRLSEMIQQFPGFQAPFPELEASLLALAEQAMLEKDVDQVFSIPEAEQEKRFARLSHVTVLTLIVQAFTQSKKRPAFCSCYVCTDSEGESCGFRDTTFTQPDASKLKEMALTLITMGASLHFHGIREYHSTCTHSLLRELTERYDVSAIDWDWINRLPKGALKQEEVLKEVCEREGMMLTQIGHVLLEKSVQAPFHSTQTLRYFLSSLLYQLHNIPGLYLTDAPSCAGQDQKARCIPSSREMVETIHSADAVEEALFRAALQTRQLTAWIRHVWARDGRAVRLPVAGPGGISAYWFLQFLSIGQKKSGLVDSHFNFPKPTPLFQSFPFRELARIDDLHQEIQRVTQGQKHFERFLGRTLILRVDGQSRFLALKFQKTREHTGELIKEYNMANNLSSQPQLLSEYPKPQFLGEVSSQQLQSYLSCFAEHPGFDEFRQMMTQEERVGVYAYTAPPAYFIYLHDPRLSDDELSTAVKASVSDLSLLLQQKGLVFDRLADLFHCRDWQRQRRIDRGRYLVLVTWLCRNTPGVSGGVQNWKAAVEYVNLRASGLADVGDYENFSWFAKMPFFDEITKGARSHREAYRDHRVGSHPAEPCAKQLIYGNCLAEYLFVLTLTLGRRAAAMPDTLQSLDVWLKTAQHLFRAAVQMLHTLTGLSERAATHYLKPLFDEKAAAQEMQYWMGGKYVFDSERPNPPYCPHAGISANVVPFVEGVGYSSDGVNPHLTTKFSDYPLRQDVSLYYGVPEVFFSVKKLARTYRDATFACEEAIQKGAYPEARKELEQLRVSRYPHHSFWQSRHIVQLSRRITAGEGTLSPTIT